MPKKRTKPKSAEVKPARRTTNALVKSRASNDPNQTGYASVLTDLTQVIRDSRRRALATVNRELVCLYWYIGRTIVEQQETANWGDAVVEQLAADLRAAFPDMKGLSLANIWKMRQFYRSCREIDHWLDPNLSPQKLGATPRQLDTRNELLSTVSRVSRSSAETTAILSTLSREFTSAELAALIPRLSWSRHTEVLAGTQDPAERYFYLRMSAAERWSVRELRRQIDADLFTRYVSVKRDPEKCLPDDAETGDLLPFKDHYILEFLGLEDEHSEKELRKAILANLRDFFLEFGKDLTFVGEEYPLTVGADTFYIDLLFFHRRLQCLIAVDLKKGKFKPKHAGKSRFYCAALDEQLRLPHENPSLGLVLCRSADSTQVRLALTAAAEHIGIATYQTALPDETQLRRRLEQLPQLPEDDQ
jgi:predicted nuclease of restriction endonuclease-like (RecB) superfamily